MHVVCVEYEEGAEGPFCAELRTDLSLSDWLFTPDTIMGDVLKIVAPFVVGWNLGLEDGTPVPAPAAGGSQQLECLPPALLFKMMADIKYYAQRSRFPSPELLEGVS